MSYCFVMRDGQYLASPLLCLAFSSRTSSSDWAEICRVRHFNILLWLELNYIIICSAERRSHICWYPQHHASLIHRHNASYLQVVQRYFASFIFRYCNLLCSFLKGTLASENFWFTCRYVLLLAIKIRWDTIPFQLVHSEINFKLPTV